jgi:ABC-2 type transport system ATP-binding protein
VRTLVRDLPKRCGVTVFLSSHLLSEVEQTATDFAIISRGTLKFEGTLEELPMRSEQTIVVEVDQPERAHALLTGMGYTVTREGDRILIAPDRQFGSAQINSILVQAGIAVSHLSTRRMTLEDVFLELTNDTFASATR